MSPLRRLSIALGGVYTLSCASPARDPEAEAEAAYSAELDRCASTEPTKDAAWTCIDRVRAKWHVTMTEADGWSGIPNRDGGTE